MRHEHVCLVSIIAQHTWFHIVFKCTLNFNYMRRLGLPNFVSGLFNRFWINWASKAKQGQSNTMTIDSNMIDSTGGARPKFGGLGHTMFYNCFTFWIREMVSLRSWPISGCLDIVTISKHSNSYTTTHGNVRLKRVGRKNGEQKQII